MLLIAAGACAYGREPAVVIGLPLLGAAAMAISFVRTTAAAAGLVAALLGLLLVFAGYVRADAPIAWTQTTAIVANGLAAVFALMVLLEREEKACA